MKPELKALVQMLAETTVDDLLRGEEKSEGTRADSEESGEITSPGGKKGVPAV